MGLIRSRREILLFSFVGFGCSSGGNVPSQQECFDGETGGETGGFNPVVCSDIQEEYADLPDVPFCGDDTDEARGRWSVLTEDPNGFPDADSFPMLAIHMIHRPDGTALVLGASPDPVPDPDDPNPQAARKDREMLWTFPPTCTPADLGPGEECALSSGGGLMNDFVDVTHPDDFFCSGHVTLPDGSTLLAGGQWNPFVNWKGLATTVRLLADGTWEVNEERSATDQLTKERWYPTLTTLSSGDVLITAGAGVELLPDALNPNVECFSDQDCDNTTEDLGCEKGFRGPGGCECACVVADSGPTACRVGDNVLEVDAGVCMTRGPDEQRASAQIYHPDAALGSRLGPEVSATVDVTYNANYFPWYPLMYVLPEADLGAHGTSAGSIFYAGAEVAAPESRQGHFVTPQADDSLSIMRAGGPTCADGSAGALWVDERPGGIPATVMKFGGGDFFPNRITEVIEFGTGSTPKWERPAGSQTHVPKHFSHLILLPDGTAFSVSGSQHVPEHTDHSGDADHFGDVVPSTELWDPESKSWCRLRDADPTAYRGYHSQSMLLPDGRIVLTSSGYLQGASNPDRYSAQFYEPPYLHQGPRPSFSLNDTGMQFGSDGNWQMPADGSIFTLDVDDDSDPIVRVTMIKLSAQTHQNDMESRFIELLVEDNDSDIDIVTPSDTCSATPGYYMLFGLSEPSPGVFVPSIARYVSVDGTCATSAPEECEDNAPITFEMRSGTSAPGLHVTCLEPDEPLNLSALGIDLNQMCDALPLCPGLDDFQFSLSTTDNDGNVVNLASGVSATEATSFEHSFGPGDVTLTACLDGLGCVDQQLLIEGPMLGATDASGQFASETRRDFVELHELEDTFEFEFDADETIAVPLPDEFGFRHYGEQISEVFVGKNGGIRFSAGTISDTPVELDGSNNQPQIAAFWTKLNVSDGHVLAAHDHDNDRFIVSWEHVGASQLDHEVSFQVHLYSGGRVQFHYEDDAPRLDVLGDGGPNVVVGMQGAGEILDLVSVEPRKAIGGAVEIGSSACNAPPPEFPGWTVCQSTLVPEDRELVTCRPDGETFELSPPPFDALCPGADRLHRTGYVVASGPTIDALEPLPRRLRIDGENPSVELSPGVHQIEWEVITKNTAEGGLYETHLFGPFSEFVTVHLDLDGDASCCDAGQQLVTLSDGRDVFAPNDDADTCVLAFGGRDFVDMGSGFDTVVGGKGSDYVCLGDGAGVGFGNKGHDFLAGGVDMDSLFGGRGHDLIDGGSGSDTLDGGPGHDVLLGADGDDLLVGRGQSDVIFGEAGDDTLAGGSGRDVLIGGAGDDTFIISASCEARPGETIHGGPGHDTLLLPAGETIETLRLRVFDVEQVAVVGVVPALAEATCQ